MIWKSSRGVVVNVQEFDIGVNEFELQSLSKVYFLTNTIGKGMYPLISPWNRLNTTTTFFY